MNANDIASAVADDANLSRVQAKAIVDKVFATLQDAALKGEEVSVPGFGKFKVQNKPARTARNPRTGESIAVPATKKLVFQPAKALKDSLAK